VLARTSPCRATVRHAQYGRLPLHIAAMQQGEASLEEIKALLSAHPQGAMEKDNVCAAARSHPLPFCVMCISMCTQLSPHCRTVDCPTTWP